MSRGTDGGAGSASRWLLALPFLVAIGPVVRLWSANVAMVRPIDGIVATGLMALIAFVLVGGMTLLTRDPVRASITVGVGLLSVMTFGNQLDAVPGPDPMTVKLLLLVANAGLATALIATLWRNEVSRAWVFATLIAFVFVALSVPGLITGSRTSESPASQEATEGGGGPDVYYIILDAYAREDVLADLYGLDNSPFLNGLRERGFYVADESYSNYSMTQLSLAATLTMEYLSDQAPYEPGEVDHLIQDAKVIHEFRQRGYRYIFFETSWFGTDEAPLADMSVGRGAFGTDFIRTLIRTTLPGSFLETMSRHTEVLLAFEELAEVADISGPTFTFAHLLVPHPPLMFRADGSIRPYIDDLAQPFDREAYAEQLKFVNSKVEDVVDSLISRSDETPVIILQGDHGTARMLGDAEEVWWERHAILNAMLVPPSVREDLYPSVSPVNTFRAVVPGLFGGDPVFLDDRSFYNWYDPHDSPAVMDDPFQLIDVTEALP